MLLTQILQRLYYFISILASTWITDIRAANRLRKRNNSSSLYSFSLYYYSLSSYFYKVVRVLSLPRTCYGKGWWCLKMILSWGCKAPWTPHKKTLTLIIKMRSLSLSSLHQWIHAMLQCFHPRKVPLLRPWSLLWPPQPLQPQQLRISLRKKHRVDTNFCIYCLTFILFFSRLFFSFFCFLAFNPQYILLRLLRTYYYSTIVQSYYYGSVAYSIRQV